MPRFSFAQVKGSDRVKVALVGCGGRGTGAACNMIAADPNVKFVALGDLFNGRSDRAANKIYEFAKKTVGEAKASEIIDTSKVKKFVGWDNIDQVLAEDVDLVIDATPPVFRTPHYEKIVAAGKHAFLEKPGAVDVIQGRKMYELAKEAEKKGLCVVCGNQRRYDNRYQDLVKRNRRTPRRTVLLEQRRLYWRFCRRRPLGRRQGGNRGHARIPDTQLVELHLGFRRPYCRAARP